MLKRSESFCRHCNLKSRNCSPPLRYASEGRGVGPDSLSVPWESRERRNSMSKRNITAVVLGLLLFVGGTAGFLVFAQLINPPTTEVVVAVVDIPPGTTLTEAMLAVDNVHVSPKVLNGLVRKSELSQFIGSTVVEPVSQYEFLRKAAVAAAGNPASAQRVALALSDPNLVAMVVPVKPETAPPSIVEGDYVDLSFGVPSNASFGSSMEVEPTPDTLGSQFFQPFEATPVFVEATDQPTAV